METRYCPDCREERAVVQPPCADGHFECPEWACIECGSAIIGGWLLDDGPVSDKVSASKVSRQLSA